MRPREFLKPVFQCEFDLAIVGRCVGRPFSSVVGVTDWFVARLVTVTKALGTRAPPGSVTSPRMPPRSTWPNRAAGAVRKTEERSRANTSDHCRLPRLGPPGFRHGVWINGHAVVANCDAPISRLSRSGWDETRKKRYAEAKLLYR